MGVGGGVTMKPVDHIHELYSDVENGILDPVKAYVMVYEAEKMYAELRKDLIDQVLEKIAGEKDYTCGEYRVLEASRTTWKIDDPEVERMKAIIKAREILAKKAFKASERGEDFFDENGEIIPPAEPKYSTFIKLERI
jgi:hypothetical protein